MSNYVETYNVDSTIFSPVRMDELKKREKVLINCNTAGYYCCKIWHEKLYREMIEAYVQYITKNNISSAAT